MTNKTAINLKYRIINTLALSFILFIIWIIYTADTGGTIVFVKMVKFLPYPDKFGHFFLFGLLTLVLNVWFKFKKYQIKKHTIYTGTVLVSIFVVLEELSQGFLSTRSMDIVDLIADGFGISVFTVLSYFISNYKPFHDFIDTKDTKKLNSLPQTNNP